MFGAAIRAAMTFAGGMLFASVLSAVLSPFVSQMSSNLPSEHLLLQTFETAQLYFPMFVLMSGVIALIARAFIERQAGAGGQI